MTIYKSAKAKNGTIHIGDTVTHTNKDGSIHLHGIVKYIYKTGVGVMLVSVYTSKGVLRCPASSLFKE